MQWKWGEHHRYHILCNGKGMNIIDIMFYVMENGKWGEHHRYHILCNGKGVNIIGDIMCYEHHRYHIFYVMEMG